ncbi:MAG: TolC family protein [Phycisphaerales bacterium]|nr:TolC family protein [Phycisphaerales bacterium]MCE7975071.1 TolC family protein [Leptolyngbya sp. PLA1]
MNKYHRIIPIGIIILAGLGGCTGTPTASERKARSDVDTVRSMYRPGDAKPTLPNLSKDSPLADYLRFAMLNNPRVEAEYYAWAASVERITGARSLPDPRITFEADITNVLETVMPGLMIDLPGPGKLRAAGNVAAGESRASYFKFEIEVLRTAMALKSAYFRLHFLEDTLRVQREKLTLLGDLETQAQQQVAAGRSGIQDVLRAQIDREQLTTQIANLEDSRGVLLAEFRSALGLRPDDQTVPVPDTFESSPPPPPADQILALAAAHNPQLRQMEAEVRRGEAMIDLARTSRVPDFSIGIEADVKASPVMWRPTGSITLPIWRDKIAAEISAAQFEKRSSEARLSAEQIGVAADLAAMLYMYRESTRNSDLYATTLLPKAHQSLDAARSGYAVGRSSFLDVIDAERQLLVFDLSLVEARTQRELSLASLSLLIAGTAPEGAPILPTAPAPSKEANP